VESGSLLSPCSIIINRCRFENNSAIRGVDIYNPSSSCFSPNTITETCSSLSNGIFCNTSVISEIVTICEKKIVCILFYFI
jgi:hypothetical protein